MLIHLMAVPTELIAKVSAGSAIVNGAIIKDAVTQQILAHLQPTSGLSGLILQHALGGPGAPVALASIASSVTSNVQLLQLKKMVETVQAVASLGAAVSVVNLGVSVGGFAMVLRSLKRVESRLDAMSTAIHDVATRQKADFIGRSNRALMQAHEAYSLSSDAERTRYWQEADSTLGELVEVANTQLSLQGLVMDRVSESPAELSSDLLRLLMEPAAVDNLRWLLTLGAARVELLLCLGHVKAAGDLASRLAGWMKALPVNARSLAQARLAGQLVSPSQMKLITDLAKATSTLVSASGDVAEERAQLCAWLDAAGVDPREHMLRIHSDNEPKLLTWCKSES